MTNPRTHQFLKIGRYHRNEKDAEALVLSYLTRIIPGKPESYFRAKAFGFGTAPRRRSFVELCQEARERGCVVELWHFADSRNERHFPPQIGLEAGGSGFEISTTFAAQTHKVPGPGRVHPMEDELSEDILAFRRDACAASTDTYAQTGRSCRAYLLTCTALVEAFLSRHVHVNQDLVDRGDEKLRRLTQPLSFEERIELWTEIFCDAPLAELKKTDCWSDYEALRQARNSFLHGAHATIAFSLRELPLLLNRVRRGVGGFLAKLRELQDLPPLPFIQRLETAPRVEFIELPAPSPPNPRP
jgi:hypothetical protein